jgi:hypothetical protein
MNGTDTAATLAHMVLLKRKQARLHEAPYLNKKRGR